MPLSSGKIRQLHISQVTLSGGFRISATWDASPPIDSDVVDAQFGAFQTAHRAAWGPSRRLEDLAALGPVLGRLLGFEETFISTFHEAERIELRAKPQDSLFTDVLWEMTSTTDWLPAKNATWIDHFDHTLAALPLARVVEGDSKMTTLPESRPTMLWCASNEPLGRGKLDFSQFDDVYTRLKERWSAIKMERISTDAAGRTTWPEAKAEIQNRKPTILALLAHGSSSPAPPVLEPSALFRSPTTTGNEWIPVSRIATAIGDAGSTALVILVCCDLTRADGGFSNGQKAAYSAALEMVKRGAPEVIAMQAPIHVHTASAFLHGFLADWLHRFQSSHAIASGRRAAIESSEPGYSWLPTLFCSEASLNSTELPEIANKIKVAVSDPAYLPVPAGSFVERQSLLREFGPQLANRGAVRIVSPIGAGCTTFLAMALRMQEKQPGSRPALYFDCSRPGPEVDVPERVVSWLVEMRMKHPVLFPPGTQSYETIRAGSPFQLGRGVARGIADAELTVVFDNIETTECGEGRDFWQGLISEACLMTTGLVIIAGQLPHEVYGGCREFILPNLEEREIAELLSSVAPDLGARAAEIFRLTDGSPLLIDAFLKVYIKSGEAMAITSLNATSERYVQMLLQSLSTPASHLLYRLAASDVAVAVGTASKHILWNILEADRNMCVASGAIRQNRVGGEVWWSVPAHVRGVLLNVQKDDVISAADDIVEHWDHLDDPDHRRLENLLLQTGGVGVAVHLAECHHLVGEVDIALDIAAVVIGSNTSLAARFRFASRVSDWAVKADPVHAGVHLDAARLALWIGRLDRITDFLQRVPADAAVTLRVEANLLAARLLKDSQQHRGIAEAQRSLKEAQSLVDSRSGDFGDSRTHGFYDWQIRYEKLRLALFFGIMPDTEFETFLEETIRRVPSEGEKARVLATVAEAEMKRGANADWEKVAEWALEATQIAEKPGNSCPDRSHCAYQYARYLENRSGALHETIRQYAKAEEFAEEENQPARQGLAMFRRISFEARVLSDQPAKSEEAKTMWLGEIRQILKKIGTAGIGALECRTRVRLLELAADLSSPSIGTGKTLDILEEAVKAASMSCLLAASDLDRLLRLLCRFLETAQFSSETFRRQQGLLSAVRLSVESLTERLGSSPLRLPLDRPVEALRMIREYRSKPLDYHE